MATASLDALWSKVEQRLPAGWSLRGVIRGPREADPQIRGSSWVAVARPEDPRSQPRPVVEGRGSTPDEALADLLVEIGEL